MSLKKKGTLINLFVIAFISASIIACDPNQSVGPQELFNEQSSNAGTGQDTVIYEVTDLSKAYGFNVAWDINDQGEIIGGSQFLDSDENLIHMGSIFARAINNHGDVAGSYMNEAAIWNAAEGLLKLGSIEDGWSTAFDLNNNGDVVGEIIYEFLVYEDEEYGDVYDYEYNAFVWNRQEGMKKITEDGWAEGVNDIGQVVGIDYTLPNRGFVWDANSGTRDLGDQHGFTSANVYAVNNEGQVTGSVLVSFDDDGDKLASYNNPNHNSTSVDHTDKLLRLSNTKGIYDFGHVKEMLLEGTFLEEAFPWERNLSTGFQSTDDLHSEFGSTLEAELEQQLTQSVQNVTYRSEAFIWSQSEGYINLGTLGGKWSTAWDINDQGQVVGYSSIGNNKNRAFLWDPEHGMIELPTLGGNSLARSINNQGQIVGYSYDENGNFFPVTWKPVIQ